MSGKINVKDLSSLLSKSHKGFKGYNLNENNPTDVKDWIPTGSRWLDASICKGRLAGIPVGKITEIAGESGVGKSYMAMQIAINAQKKDYNVIYFDSEMAIDSVFLEKAGCDLDNFLYVPAKSVENVLETIETIMANSSHNLFIWDSLAFTPCETDLESDFNPTSSMALKPRILSKGLSKLLLPIAESQSAFVILNQLKTNIATGPGARIKMMMEPWVTPGGKSLIYAYSLRIWLTARKSKAARIQGDKGYDVGNEVKAKLQKSRFGTQNRVCSFNIVWGDYDNIGIMDEQSWLEAIKESEHVTSGGWWKIQDVVKETEYTFRSAGFKEKILEEPEFKEVVLRIMDEEVIEKFNQGEGDVERFYKLDEDEETVLKT